MMPSLSLRVSQSLTLTPQLQQSIRLLQLGSQRQVLRQAQIQGLLHSLKPSPR